MAFVKGDVIAVDFKMPNTGDYKKHSAVVISEKGVYEHDKCYICVMMSSNNVTDKFSFPLTGNMLKMPANKEFSQVRCHLITYVRERDAISNGGKPFNQLTEQAIDRLIEFLVTVSFGY